MDKIARRYCWLLIWACFAVYTATSCLKMVYSSELIEIVNRLGETKARVGLGLTAYFTTYFIGQVALAPFTKKINLGYVMIISLVIQAVLFSLIPFTTNLYQMWIIIGLAGLANASTYGGCMHFLGIYLPQDLNEAASSIMSVGFIGGTMVSYVIAPAFIEMGLWQWTFVLFAVILVLSLVFFVIAERKIKRIFKERNIDTSEKNDEIAKEIGENKGSSNKRLVSTIVVLMSLSMFFIHFAYYIFSNWFPAYLNEQYGVSQSNALLVMVALYVIAYGCTNFGLLLCSKFKVKLSRVLRIFVVVTFAATLAQAVAYKSGLIFALLFTMLIIAFSRALGSIIGSYFPLRIKSSVSTAISALLFNAAAGLGAAIGPSVSGSIQEAYGWGAYHVLGSAIFFISLITVYLSTHFAKKLNV